MCRSKQNGGRRCNCKCGSLAELKAKFPELYEAQREKANRSRSRNRHKLNVFREMCQERFGLDEKEARAALRGMTPNSLLALSMSLEDYSPGITEDINRAVSGMPGTHNMVVSQVYTPLSEHSPSVTRANSGHKRLANIVKAKVAIGQKLIEEENEVARAARHAAAKADEGKPLSVKEKALLDWQPAMTAAARKRELEKLDLKEQAVEVGFYDAMWALRTDDTVNERLAAAKDERARRKILEDDRRARAEQLADNLRENAVLAAWVRKLTPEQLEGLCDDSDKADETFTKYALEHGKVKTTYRPLNDKVFDQFEDGLETSIQDIEKSDLFTKHPDGIPIREGVKLVRTRGDNGETTYSYHVKGIEEPLKFDPRIQDRPFRDSQRILSVDGFDFDVDAAPYGQSDTVRRLTSPRTESGKQFRQGLARQVILDSFTNPQQVHPHRDGTKLGTVLKSPGRKDVGAEVVARTNQSYGLAMASRYRASDVLTQAVKLHSLAGETRREAQLQRLRGDVRKTVADKKGYVSSVDWSKNKIQGQRGQAYMLATASDKERPNVIQGCHAAADGLKSKFATPLESLPVQHDKPALYLLNTDPAAGDDYSESQVRALTESASRMHAHRTMEVGSRPLPDVGSKQAAALYRAYDMRLQGVQNAKIELLNNVGDAEARSYMEEVVAPRRIETYMDIDNFNSQHFGSVGRQLTFDRFVMASNDEEKAAGLPQVHIGDRESRKKVRVVMMTNQCLSMSKDLAVVGPAAKFRVVDRSDDQGNLTLFVTDEDVVMDMRPNEGVVPKDVVV